MGTVCDDVFALLLGVTGRLCFVSLALPWTSHISFYGVVQLKRAEVFCMLFIVLYVPVILNKIYLA